jgi:hypothetical protein
MLISLNLIKICTGFITRKVIYSKCETSEILAITHNFIYVHSMDSRARRAILLKTMDDLENQGISCRGCAGNCCTYEANSMMVTPLEALEVLHFLNSSPMKTMDLKDKMLQTIKQYRLEHPAGPRGKTLVRKTYTCPFFNHQELGCPLPREIKPYGCLAFNAHDLEKKASEFCFSDLEIQKKRAQDFGWEDQKNLSLQEKFKIFWEKTPLPLALVELWDVDVSAADLLPG